MTEQLEVMLGELESSYLEVQLVPQRRFTNSGGCIRVAVSKNCTWYRQFCARHASSRGVRRGKFDTRIRRANVLALLTRLVAGCSSKSKYAAELYAIARRMEVAA